MVIDDVFQNRMDYFALEMLDYTILYIKCVLMRNTVNLKKACYCGAPLNERRGKFTHTHTHTYNRDRTHPPFGRFPPFSNSFWVVILLNLVDFPSILVDSLFCFSREAILSLYTEHKHLQLP